MKVELLFDGEGNLMINKNGEVTHYYCEYSIPNEIEDILKKIPKYKEEEIEDDNE